VWLVCALRGVGGAGRAEYAWRGRGKGPRRPRRRQPTWDGSALAGRTVLLPAEQGLGDTLQFIRYAALVKARGGTVVVECQHALVPLLRTCPDIDRVVAVAEALPPIDVQAPLLSLPRIFETT